MRTLLVSIVATVTLHAQAVEKIASDFYKIDNVCVAEDIEALGLTCSEDDPCPVYLELASVQGSGAKIFVTGNLHTGGVTISGLLLASDDSGRTWSEPLKRIRSAELEQIQFADDQHGWVSGVMLDPLPRAPFLLLTADGGQHWHSTPISKDPDFGSIQRFWFESAGRGRLVLDRSQGRASRYEVYSTTDGGETWSRQAAGADPVKLPANESSDTAEWRALPTKDYDQVQHRTLAGWATVARFPTKAGECK